MATVDKIKVGTTTYNVSPAPGGTLTGYTSGDAASPTAWSAVNAITTSDTNASIFNKVTTMVKNIRWLYNKLGTTNFSATGQSTVTGALSALQAGLNGKANASHTHTTAQLPVSNSQTNSTSYIPTSALVYSMQQQITSLNDAIANLGSSSGCKIAYGDASYINNYSPHKLNCGFYPIALFVINSNSTKNNPAAIEGCIRPISFFNTGDSGNKISVNWGDTYISLGVYKESIGVYWCALGT